jgi:hypothetical protein
VHAHLASVEVHVKAKRELGHFGAFDELGESWDVQDGFTPEVKVDGVESRGINSGNQVPEVIMGTV